MEIRRANLEEIFDLRHKILRPNRPKESAIFHKDVDPETIHYALIDDGAVQAVLTMTDVDMLPKSLDFLSLHLTSLRQLRGMAVDKNVQGKGYGKQLIEFVLAEYENEKKYKAIWCNARTYALPFYQKIGFKEVGDVFDVPLVGPHMVMYREV